MKTHAILILCTIVFIASCQPTPADDPIPVSTTSLPTQPQITPSIVTGSSTLPPTQVTSTVGKQPTPTLKKTNPKPSDWMKMPVIPVISDNVRLIYEKGQSLGNHPDAFSKVGDCGSTPSWFLGDFDRGERFYNLGSYTSLQQVIDYYHGSFERTSLAALSGYNTSSVLTPLWSNKELCQSDESPLACEYRIHRPSIAFITLGANDVYHLDTFETHLREIIEYSIAQGVIPILATKPDNIEGDHRINSTIAALAVEYDIPLWNYWLAVQPLPNHGLQEDNVHITFASNDFSNPLNMQAGWPVRNLNALQMLQAIYTYLNP